MGGSRVYETQEAHSATVGMLGHTECLLNAAVVIGRLAGCGLGLLHHRVVPVHFCLMPAVCKKEGDERNVDELADVQEVHVKGRRNRKAYLTEKQETEGAKSR